MIDRSHFDLRFFMSLIIHPSPISFGNETERKFRLLIIERCVTRLAGKRRWKMFTFSVNFTFVRFNNAVSTKRCVTSRKNRRSSPSDCERERSNLSATLCAFQVPIFQEINLRMRVIQHAQNSWKKSCLNLYNLCRFCRRN